MKDTFTMKELAAIIVRRSKLILIFAIVFALLLGGWEIIKPIKGVDTPAPETVPETIPEITPEQIETNYQNALIRYNSKKENLEYKISFRQEQLDAQLAYNEGSLLMQLDPTNKAVTQINFMVADLNNEELKQLFQLEATTLDYVVNRIHTQYDLYWNSIDLQKELSHTSWRNFSDKYIREVVSLNNYSSGGGYLAIIVSATTEEISNEIAEALYQVLLRYQPTVSNNSFQHQLALVSQVTQFKGDEEMETAQATNLAKAESYRKTLEDLQNQLSDLKEPTREEIAASLATPPEKPSASAPAPATPTREIGKYAVLGAALGIALGMVWVILSYLLRNRLELSHHLAQALSVPMLGSVATQKSWLDRLADRILGERVWEDNAQALEYLSASALAHLPENANIALLSTLHNTNLSQLRSVLDMLQNQGFHVRIAVDACHNPLAVSAMKESSCVILAERCGASSWNAIQEIATLADNMEKPVKGFLLV